VGPPAALVLTLEDSQGLPYLADGADVALVRCAVVDASGTLDDGLNFKDEDDDDDLNNFEALKAKTQMKAMQ
jgi:hypothetical protein